MVAADTAPRTATAASSGSSTALSDAVSTSTSMISKVSYASVASAVQKMCVTTDRVSVSNSASQNIASAPHSTSVNRTLRKSVLLKNASQTVYRQDSTGQTSSTGFGSQLGKTNFDKRRSIGSTWNPSLAPNSIASSSAGSWRQPNRSSTYNGSTTAIASTSTGVCKLSGRTKRDYRPGHIVTLPHHTPNTNPYVDPQNDPRWKSTIEGPVYSKRRMMVVMWIYEQDMFCLPLYSFGGNGLRGKPPYLLKEYVAVKNRIDAHFFNQSPYEPVEVVCGKKLSPDSTIQLSGGFKVACQEDTYIAGEVTKESFGRLLELWQNLAQTAQNDTASQTPAVKPSWKGRSSSRPVSSNR